MYRWRAEYFDGKSAVISSHKRGSENRRLYAAAEDRVRAADLGLWHDANAVPPWEWRRGSKEGLH